MIKQDKPLPFTYQIYQPYGCGSNVCLVNIWSRYLIICHHRSFSVTTDSTDLSLLTQTQLTFPCYYRPHWPSCVTTDPTNLSLLPQTQLTVICYHRLNWPSCVDTDPTDLPVLPQTQLTFLCYHRLNWPLSVTTDSTDLPVLPQTPLTFLCYHRPNWPFSDTTDSTDLLLPHTYTVPLPDWSSLIITHLHVYNPSTISFYEYNCYILPTL